MVIRALAVVLGIAAFALAIWARAQAARFLAEHDAIRTPEALARFKALARGNMYGAVALLAIAAAWLPALLYVGLEGGAGAKAAVALAGVAMSVVTRRGKRLEAAARSLPSEPSLRPEYERVSGSWARRALPDF